MADQKDRPLLHSDDAVRRRHVVGQRTQRVLNRDRLETALRQKRNDLCPTGAVCERPMDEHYSFDCHVNFSSHARTQYSRGTAHDHPASQAKRVASSATRLALSRRYMPSCRSPCADCARAMVAPQLRMKIFTRANSIC